jgi:broad specificity phosphatase PhoE
VTASATLLLVRHGVTAWNAAGRLQGRAEVPLDMVGRVQIRRLVPVVRRRAPALLYTSPLCRALESARELAGPLGMEVRVLDDLAEIDYGIWQGRTEAECRHEWPLEWPRWRTRPWRVRCPGGETGAAFAARIAAAGNRIAADARGRIALVVTHGHVVRLLAILARAAPATAFWRLCVPNASLRVLDVDRQSPFDPDAFTRVWSAGSPRQSRSAATIAMRNHP